MPFLALLLAISTQTGATQITPPNFAGFQPQIAAVGNKVYVACGRGDSIYVLRSADSGIKFSSPVALPTRGKLSLGMRRGPRISVTGGAIVVSAIYGAKGGGKDGDLVAFRSLDDGKTWRGPAKVSDVPDTAREGLHSMASSKSGLTACVWLDMRGTGTTVMISTSKDGGETWSKNKLVYRSPSGTVCECCQPSVTFGPDGKLHVMFRNSLEGNRDMYLLSSANGGNTFGPATKLGRGSWPLEACPMDGGGITVTPAGKIVTTWRRANTIYLSSPGRAEVKIGEGTQPWIASSGTNIFLAWQGSSSVIGPDPVVTTVGAKAMCVWADGEGRIWSLPLKPYR